MNIEQSPSAGNEPVIINIARDFSRYPGGRFYDDGDATGEKFREEVLVPALRTNRPVVVELDGAAGYGSSFLEEGFGGTVRVRGIDCSGITFVSKNDSLVATIQGYIQDAKERAGLALS